MMSPGNNKYLEEVNSWMLLLFICWSGNHLSISPSLHLSIFLSLSVSQLWASGDVISLAVAMFLTVFTCFRGSKHPTSASPPSLHLPPPPSTSLHLLPALCSFTALLVSFSEFSVSARRLQILMMWRLQRVVQTKLLPTLSRTDTPRQEFTFFFFFFYFYFFSFFFFFFFFFFFLSFSSFFFFTVFSVLFSLCHFYIFIQKFQQRNEGKERSEPSVPPEVLKPEPSWIHMKSSGEFWSTSRGPTSARRHACCDLFTRRPPDCRSFCRVVSPAESESSDLSRNTCDWTNHLSPSTNQVNRSESWSHSTLFQWNKVQL